MATFCSFHKVQMHSFQDWLWPILPGSFIPSSHGHGCSLPSRHSAASSSGDCSWFFPFPLKCPVLHSLIKLSLQDSISHFTLGLPLLRHTLADAGSCLPAGYPGIPPEHWWVCGLNLLRWSWKGLLEGPMRGTQMWFVKALYHWGFTLIQLDLPAH